MARGSRPKKPERTRQHVKRSFGFPGTVLHEHGRFRMWMDQNAPSLLESSDGLTFTHRPDAINWSWRGQRGCGHHVMAQTFTLAARDDNAPVHERYVGAFHCGRCLSHNPDPRFSSSDWEAHRVPRPIWLEAPLSKGARGPLWESTCVALSG